MPELPDVQVLKEYVDATSLHRRIEDVFLRDNVVTDVSPQRIRDGLRLAELVSARRHGKHLFLETDGRGWLRLHFGMTGELAAYEGHDDPEHTELRLDLADGSHLAYVTTRKFGEISWVDDVDAFIGDRALGPDPLTDGLDRDGFRERLRPRRGTIKGTLMNQEVVAGLGNLYVDEILFHAGIHPEAETSALDDGAVDAVFDAMHEVIAGAIDSRADPAAMPADWLLPHREPDEPCPTGDGGTVRKVEVSGRPTYFCPAHQRRG